MVAFDTPECGQSTLVFTIILSRQRGDASSKYSKIKRKQLSPTRRPTSNSTSKALGRSTSRFEAKAQPYRYDFDYNVYLHLAWDQNTYTAYFHDLGAGPYRTSYTRDRGQFRFSACYTFFTELNLRWSPTLHDNAYLPGCYNTLDRERRGDLIDLELTGLAS